MAFNALEERIRVLEKRLNEVQNEVTPLTVGKAHRAAAGTVTTAATLALNASADVSVTFPAGRFTAPPVVTGISSSVRVTVGVQVAPTTTGVTFRQANFSNAAETTGVSPLRWIALQMTPTSGEG